MELNLIFEIEKFLSIIVTALAFGAFFFTIRHRKYYSCWARSAILLGALVVFYSSYNCAFCDPATRAFIVREMMEMNLVLATVQVGYSLSLALFIYTILRFKWSARREFKRIGVATKKLTKDLNNINRIKE